MDRRTPRRPPVAVERLALTPSGQVRYALIARELSDKPLVNVATYRRDSQHVGQFVDFCPLEDRLVDSAAGVPRFDTRPPADLAPR